MTAGPRRRFPGTRSQSNRGVHRNLAPADQPWRPENTRDDESRRPSRPSSESTQVVIVIVAALEGWPSSPRGAGDHCRKGGAQQHADQRVARSSKPWKNASTARAGARRGGRARRGGGAPLATSRGVRRLVDMDEVLGRTLGAGTRLEASTPRSSSSKQQAARRPWLRAARRRRRRINLRAAGRLPGPRDRSLLPLRPRPGGGRRA